jgi:hypothetical protein
VPRSRTGIILLGLFAVAVVAIISYAPALKMQFRPVDDYTLVAWAAQLPLSDYLVHALDPRMQGNFYRPIFRLLLLGEYQLFGAEAGFYHLAQVLLHAANVVLVTLVIQRLSARWRIALLAGFFYAAYPTASEPIFWISDAVPLATLFALASLWCWVGYLRNNARSDYWLAVATMVLAFLSKEVTIVLPIVLFLSDRLLIRDTATLAALVRRYLPIAILSAAYIALEIAIQRQGIYLNEASYTLGAHVLANYISYFGMLALPWGSIELLNHAVALGTGLTLITLAVRKRSLVPLFLLLVAFVLVGPVVLSPQGVFPRYLYLAAVPWAIAWASVFQHSGWVLRSRALPIAASLVVVTLLLANSFSVANAAVAFSENAIRRVRVPYRDIMREHPSLAGETLFFLIDPPYIPISDAAGMFFLQYGAQVTVRGTYEDGAIYVGGRMPSQRANLREHPRAFVYYFDETLKARQVRVDKTAETHALPALPADFEISIRLEGYEISSASLERGEAFALLLYWRALGRIEKDYTVFVHLVNAQREIVAGEDSFPRGGREHTSQWRVNQFTADGHVLIVPPDAPLGQNYHLEVGLYYRPTLERVPIVDADGNVIVDKIVIGPLSVVE